MSNAKKGQKGLEKEDLLQALVVVDDFEGVFANFTEEGSPALLPVANFHVIDYVLECLGRYGFQETILFCCSHAQALRDHLKKSRWSQAFSTMKVIVLVSENCRSLGDVLRDVDHKAIIKGDFLLLSSFTITNLNLTDLLNRHRQTFSKDKGTVMTLVLQDVGSRNPRIDDTTYIVNAVTNKLLMCVKASSEIGKFEIPLEHLMENVNLNIYRNLIDTGIAICSPGVPILFSDNFDFQTKDDFIQGLLNEEILDSRIYCCQVENGYGATIKNWQTFQRVSLDCIHRWTFPLVPDQSFTLQHPFSYHRNCIYKQPGVQLLNSVKLEMDVMVGASSQIGHNSRILRSVIGKNCTIGQNVVIRDSFIFDNTIIEDNCKIELCVVGENSRIKENSELMKCFLKRKVQLNPKTHLEEVIVVNEGLGKNWKKLSEKAYLLNTNATNSGSDEDLPQICQSGFIDPEAHYSDNEEGEISSLSESEKSYTDSPEPDDNQLFYLEVVDSLHRGFEEKLSCDNLILEINSSRYAYNVSLSDVTVLTLKGILLLAPRVNSPRKELLKYFLPLLRNYVKTSEAQIQCLELIELGEFFNFKETNSKGIPRFGLLNHLQINGSQFSGCQKKLVNSNVGEVFYVAYYFTSPTFEICDELENDVAKCLHFLYDSDIISEDNILAWHEDLEKDSPVIAKVAPLIKWLKEAAEESSSEESN